MRIGLLGLIAIALFCQAGTALANATILPSKNVFGITIGKELALPDCLKTDAETVCIYPDYKSPLPGESDLIRVFVPKSQLPALAEDGSVRLRLNSEGSVDLVRYSFYGKDAKEGAELALTMIRLFGDGRYTFENINKAEKMSVYPRAFKVMWKFSDSIVTGVCHRLRNDEARITVDIIATGANND